MAENDNQTEGKIFEAATEVFMEKGLDGARMQDIADRAGINKSLLHYYFRTKDRLFNAVFEKVANQMFKRFAPVYSDNLTLEEKIRFFFKEHIEILKKNPGLPVFILNETSRNPARIKKIMEYSDIRKLWPTLEKQHKDELEKYNITKENFPQILTSIAAVSVFPFAGKAIISTILEKMGHDFDAYIEERKEYAADFVIRAIKK
ncbi:MAG: TetR/AcrR family transcriptional regulator [Prolixibacteraceae bacterium]|nr:TetR/AcrR family transcriptional regulator [Prolixibacteraceae bacterium]